MKTDANSVTEDLEPFSSVMHQERHPASFNQEKANMQETKFSKQGDWLRDAEVRAWLNTFSPKRKEGRWWGGRRSVQT